MRRYSLSVVLFLTHNSYTVGVYGTICRVSVRPSVRLSVCPLRMYCGCIVLVPRGKLFAQIISFFKLCRDFMPTKFARC